MQGHCWAWEIWPHDKSLLQICVSERSLIPNPFSKSEDKPAEHDAVVLCMQNTRSLFHLMFLTYRIAAIIVFDLTRYGVINPLCMCDVHSLLQHMNLQNAKSGFIYSIWQRSNNQTITRNNVPLVFEVWVDKRVQICMLPDYGVTICMLLAANQ